MASWNRFAMYGKFSRSDRHFGEWLYVTGAAQGARNAAPKIKLPDSEWSHRNRRRVVFFGEVGGNFPVVNAANAGKHRGRNLGSAIGSGVITYSAAGAQNLVEAIGLTHSVWPTHRQDHRAGRRARLSKIVTAARERFSIGKSAGSGRTTATHRFTSGLLTAPHPGFTTGKRE
jgi:hypothetical protein